MTNILNFNGFIKNVAYQTFLNATLKTFDLDTFNINEVENFGIIKSSSAEVAYSKWVSPKRTRSYPFARIYNTYNSSKIITIIPIIKDEGKDGDIDKIQYSTVSWMNLLNIYIVLAYYDTAEKSIKKNQKSKEKITNQRFDNDFVKSQINEIFLYKQSALHWNRSLLEDRFVEIFQKAIDSYEKISRETGVLVHSRTRLDQYLAKILKDFEEFKNLSHQGSLKASHREAKTSHKLEFLGDGTKATFAIQNYLGGLYYLTCDEVFRENDVYVIQESKNSNDSSLPKLCDIQDGLFKLILFSNLDSLKIDGDSVPFTCRLKLSGKNIKGSIKLLNDNQHIQSFVLANKFKKAQIEIVKALNLEAEENKKLTIEISSNS